MERGGLAASRTGKQPASLRAATEALALERALFDKGSHGQLFLLDWLSTLYSSTRNRDETQKAVQQAVAVQRRFLGETPGAGLREAHFEQAVAVRRKALGKDHALVGLALVDLALAREAHGRRDLAEAALLDALAVFKASAARRELEFGMFSHRIDANYHLHRMKLLADAAKGELREKLPPEMTAGFAQASAQAAEAEKLEAQKNTAGARAKWTEALTTTRGSLWKGDRFLFRPSATGGRRSGPAFVR